MPHLKYLVRRKEEMGHMISQLVVYKDVETNQRVATSHKVAGGLHFISSNITRDTGYYFTRKTN